MISQHSMIVPKVLLTLYGRYSDCDVIDWCFFDGVVVSQLVGDGENSHERVEMRRERIGVTHQDRALEMAYGTEGNTHARKSTSTRWVAILRCVVELVNSMPSLRVAGLT